MARSLFSRVFTDVAEVLDRRFRWHRLPVPLGLLTLFGLRTRLRESNLYDTSSTLADQPSQDGSRHLTTHTPDGTSNNLETPRWALGTHVNLTRCVNQDSVGGSSARYSPR